MPGYVELSMHRYDRRHQLRFILVTNSARICQNLHRVEYQLGGSVDRAGCGHVGPIVHTF